MSESTPYTPLGEPTPLSASEIQRLTAEGRLLRILRPDLRENIQRAIASGASENPNVVNHVLEHDGEIYLSFQGIDDPRQRELIYHLVQQLQAGAVINTALLPAPLRTILEPGHVRHNRLAAAFVLCAVTGVASGIIAMALSVLATTVLSTPVGHFAGMDITAVVFVVFCVLGWFTSAVTLWTRYKAPSAKVNTQRPSMYS